MLAIRFTSLVQRLPLDQLKTIMLTLIRRVARAVSKDAPLPKSQKQNAGVGMSYECLAPGADYQSGSQARTRTSKNAVAKSQPSEALTASAGPAVITVNAKEYARFEQCMKASKPATPQILQGAKLLNALLARRA